MDIKNTAGVNVGFPEIANALLAKSNLSYRPDMDNLAVCFGPGGRGEVAHALRARPSTADKPDSTTYVIHPSIAFSFDSLSSNSMKSRNPHSGCRRVEIAKTIDTTYPDPSKNQGGIAIVHPQVTGISCASGAELSRLAGQGNEMDLVIAYAIQGNMIGRELKNGPQGSGINKNISFTLNTIDRHAVAYLELDNSVSQEMAAAGFMAGQGAKAGSIGYREQLSPTLKAAGSGTNQIPSVIYPVIARTLTAEHSSPCIDRGQNFVVVKQYNGHPAEHIHPKVTGTLCASGAGVCRPAGLCNETDLVVAYNVTFCDANGIRSDRPNGGMYINETDKSNTITAKSGGYETAIIDCRNLIENANVSGTLQSKASGGYSLNYQNPVRIGYRVRRLTPLECERLQGFPDGWTEGLSDSARYKALGNSLAIPCAEYVLEGIARILDEMP